MAVDGNTDPTDKCAYVRVHEDIGEKAYWTVDLGRTYVIYNLTLHGRGCGQFSKCTESYKKE